MRLGAMALGVVVVAGSVGWIWWSAHISKSHTGLGGLWLRTSGSPYDLDLQRFARGLKSVEPRVRINALRPSFADEVRREHELLVHVADGLNRSGSEFGSIMIWEDIHRFGWWAPTSESVERKFFLHEREWTFGYRMSTPHDQYAEVLRAQLADAPRAPLPGSWMDAGLLANGISTKQRVVWWGYLVNAATVVGLGLMGWGGVGLGGAIVVMRRAKAGQCTKCRYDLSGLRADVTVCPECGAARE